MNTKSSEMIVTQLVFVDKFLIVLLTVIVISGSLRRQLFCGVLWRVIGLFRGNPKKIECLSFYKDIRKIAINF